MTSSFLRSAYMHKATAGYMHVDYFALSFGDNEMERVVAQDTSLIPLCVIFAFLYITLHTGSFFYAAISILQICLSIPISNLVYRWILQVVRLPAVSIV